MSSITVRTSLSREHAGLLPRPDLTPALRAAPLRQSPARGKKGPRPRRRRARALMVARTRGTMRICAVQMLEVRLRPEDSTT